MTPRDEFDELWKIWPRQVKKADARKIYENMRNSGRLPPFDDLKKSIDKYAASVKGKLKNHVLYLGTFLEGERFEDDLDTNIYKPTLYPDGKTLAEKVKEWMATKEGGEDGITKT